MSADAEIARLVVAATRDDPELAADFAAALRPHLQPEPVAATGWMTSREAAAYLGLSLDALHKRTRRRSIPAVRETVGGKLYFQRSELDRWRLEGQRS